MNRTDIASKIKVLLVSELNLAGRSPAQIDDEALLFGEEGLGLDSLDALQVAMLVEEHFGVRVPEGDEAREIYRSVLSLTEFIERARASGEGSGGTEGEGPAR